MSFILSSSCLLSIYTEGGWKHRLWTEDEVHQAFPHGLRNQVAFDEAKNYGQKSDILRYEVSE